MKQKDPRAKVSMAALLARINRRLAHDNQKLVKARSAQTEASVGEYYIVENNHQIVRQRVDPEKFARDMKALHRWEVL